jgi:cellulose synthase operon protein C
MRRVDPDKLWPVLAESRPLIAVPQQTLAAVRAHYEAGRYLDAYASAQSAGDLRLWQSPESRVLASRLAARLNGERLSRWLILSTHRQAPQQAEVHLFRAYDAFIQQGPLWVWEHTSDLSGLQDMTPEIEAGLLALRARVAFSYREFAQAWPLLDKARELAPAEPWILCEVASCYAAENKRDHALAAVEEALQMRPTMRAAVQMRSAYLLELGRMEEAIQQLETARREMQSAELVSLLLGIRRELDDGEATLELLDEWQRLSPLAPPSAAHWLAARQCDALCLLSRWPQAQSMASSVPADSTSDEDLGGYYPRLAQRIAEGACAGARRVRLTVPKLVQDHRTCGPTTLAMLCAYWAHQTTKEQIADAICYDGTYDHSERHWCMEEGLGVREFRLTWEAAVTLLDARVPFAMATVELTTAHLQAVVGYDSVRETLFIQDPGSIVYREVNAREFIKQYELNGPRCMAIVPQSNAEWLASVDLPEALLYDETYVLQRALHWCDRRTAAEALARLKIRAPGHRLVWLAELALADFDGNAVAARAAVDELIRMFPRNPRPKLRLLQLLQELGSREDRLALLQEAVRDKAMHPVFWRELAQELTQDARDEQDVWHWLRKCHRWAPGDDGVLAVMASQWWDQDEREKALTAWRFAASTADKNEQRAMQWVSAMRSAGQRDEALTWLRERTRTLGRKGPRAWITLACALDDQQHTDEALEVFGEALQLYPEDGALLLTATRMHLRSGHPETAELLLQNAASVTNRSDWHRALAALRDRQGRADESRAAWDVVQSLEPLAMDAHEAISYAVASSEGHAAACKRLEDYVSRFPHHFGLAKLRIEWLRKYLPDDAEPALRQMLEQHPTHPWVWRELSLCLSEVGEHEEAISAAEKAVELEPEAPQSLGILAGALATADRGDEARHFAREALKRSVDYTYAIHTLIDCAPTAAEMREELDFVRGQMIRQSIGSDVLHVYRDLAFTIIDPEELLEQMLEVRKARPDLWAARSAFMAQLMESGMLDAALTEAEATVQAFPLLSNAWRDLAVILRSRSELERAEEAAEQVVTLSPDWAHGWGLLADVQEHRGHLPEALATLEKGRKRLPLDDSLAAMHSGVLWRSGQRERGFQELLELVQRQTSRPALWDMAQEWAGNLGQRDDVIQAARQVTRSRPGDPASWLILAKVLPKAQNAERLEALERCITADPGDPEPYEMKAVILASQGRAEEAREAAEPEIFGTDQPHTLRGRSAWLKYEEGHGAAAMRDMQALLEDHPDYERGWHWLSDWASAAGDFDVARDAAKHLLRLSPSSAQALATAGKIEAQAGDISAAADYFTRSLKTYPGDGEVLDALCRLHWQSQNLHALAQACDLGQTDSAVWVARAYRVLQLAGQRETHGATMALHHAADCPFDLGTLPLMLARELNRTGFQERARAALQQCADAGKIGPSWALLFIKLSTAAGDWEVWRYFQSWQSKLGELITGPMQQFIEDAGHSPDGIQVLPALIAEHGPALKADLRLYAAVGQAWLKQSQPQSAATWLTDCAQRPDIEGWVLALAQQAQRSVAA